MKVVIICFIVILGYHITAWSTGVEAAVQSGIKLDREQSFFRFAELRRSQGEKCTTEASAADVDSRMATENSIVNLKSEGDSLPVSSSSDKAAWHDGALESIATSGQGLIDCIVGADGAIYCGYYDDRVIPGYPDYYGVYVKRSTDGGETWSNPDSGANGFALYNLFMDRPSIEVFESTTGTYRLLVAVSAPWPYQSSAYDIIVCWKDIGSGDNFSAVSVQNDEAEDYLIPRLKAIVRPSSPSLKRIVCSSYSYSDGILWCDRSDTNATGWSGYAAINPATDQANVWRADFIEDKLNNRLFCVWSVGLLATPDNPLVVMALSTDQGASWFPDLYRVSPSGWNSCAESDAAIASNPTQTNKTFMVVWTGQQLTTNLYNIYYSYQFLDSISVGPGSVWNPAPAGSPLIWGTVYSDTNFDNTMPAILEDNRLSLGGYRVAFLDQHQAALAQVRYTECSFDTPVSWLASEIVSAPNADPARQGSTALSMGVGYNSTTYPNRRCVMWPDFRDPEVYANNYRAWADFSQLPTFTPSPTGTAVSPTPAATATPAPIPTLSSGGIIGLLVLVGLALRRYRC